MPVKYKTNGYTLGWGSRSPIVCVEIERETDSSVWIGGRRCGKVTGYDSYFNSWLEAKNHLLANAKIDFERAKQAKDRAHSKMQEIASLTEFKKR